MAENKARPLGDELLVIRRLREENAKLRAENSLLKHGLVECCDRLWYFFGKTDGRLSDNHAQNVYDVAKYHLDKASAVRFCKIVLR